MSTKTRGAASIATATPIGPLARRAAFAVKVTFATHPSVAMPIARVRRHGVLVSRDTELLVEGFPRSANSFAVAAIELAQGRPTAIAHHTHAPAHVRRAIRLGIPSIVLLRRPDEAVGNLLLASPWLTAPHAYRAYAVFYRSLLPYRAEVVVGRFETVTTDIGAVIDAVNDRFGTRFTPAPHTPELVEHCFAAIDRHWRSRLGDGEAFERVVGRPSRWREAQRPVIDTRLHAPEAARWRDHAHTAWREFGSTEGQSYDATRIANGADRA